MTIIITGGRHYDDRAHVERVLASLEPDHVVVGDCPSGVDRFVKDWVQSRAHLSYVIYDAHWQSEGLRAGPLRNGRMIKDHPHAILFAFPGGKGTSNCKEQARKAGLVVFEVVEPKNSPTR